MNTVHPILETVTDRITERSSAPHTYSRLAKRKAVDPRAGVSPAPTWLHSSSSPRQHTNPAGCNDRHRTAPPARCGNRLGDPVRTCGRWRANRRPRVEAEYTELKFLPTQAARRRTTTSSGQDTDIGTLLADRRNLHHQRRPVFGPAERRFASISPGTSDQDDDHRDTGKESQYQLPTGRDSGFPGQSVCVRAWWRVARRGGDAPRGGGADRAVSGGHCGVGGHLPGPWIYEPGPVFADPAPRCGGADCNAGVGHNGAVIGNASSAPPPRLPRFGGWSMRPSARYPGCPRARSGPRVGRGCGTRCRSVAAAGCRCHHHYRPSDNKQDAMEILNTTDGWSPAIESRGGIRDGAWVAEATGLVEMSS